MAPWQLPSQHLPQQNSKRVDVNLLKDGYFYLQVLSTHLICSKAAVLDMLEACKWCYTAAVLKYDMEYFGQQAPDLF